MPVSFYSTPVTNTLGQRITLNNAGMIQATLDAGDAKVLTVTFDQVAVVNPPLMPVVRTQNPNVPVGIHPGKVAYFSQAGAVITLTDAPPNSPARHTNFT